MDVRAVFQPDTVLYGKARNIRIIYDVIIPISIIMNNKLTLVLTY